MLKDFFKFEFNRITGDRIIVWGFIITAMIAAFLAYSGIKGYQAFLNEKKDFLEYESKKVKQYVNYTQYGGFGFRLLFEPSPLSVFFDSNRMLYSLESNIDLSEVTRIYNVHKGRKLFSIRGNFNDFSGFLFIAGTLLMLYAGWNSFSSREMIRVTLGYASYRKLFFFSIMMRLLILNLMFLLLLIPAHLFLRLNLFVFSENARMQMSAMTLNLLILLSFFFLLGLAVNGVLRFRKTSLLWGFMCWFILIFMLPEVVQEAIFSRSLNIPANESLNIEKLRSLMAYEARTLKYMQELARKKKQVDYRREFQKLTRNFIDNIHLLNKNKELSLTRSISGLSRSLERLSLLVPTQFYIFSSGEVSGKGYYGYLSFKKYIMDIQENFLNYYIKKKYVELGSRVKPFVKKQENVFVSGGCLPDYFWVGVLLTFLYSFFLGIVAYCSIRKMVYYE